VSTQNVILSLCLYVVALLVWIAVSHARYKRRRVQARAEFALRWARQDAAWGAWCDAASRAISEHRSLPEWKEPT
jgi:hypothetical protein